MMYGAKKSDTGIVAMKAANKAVTGRCGLLEPRPVTDGNPRGQSTGRTPSRRTVTQAAEWIRRPYREISVATRPRVT